jgi:hypothetical protein
MKGILFWVQIITHQIVCVTCAGRTQMIGWMAVNKDLKAKMYEKDQLRCSVCGAYN